jgi:hypothetical protein
MVLCGYMKRGELTTPVVMPKKIWTKVISKIRWRERSRKGRGSRDFMSARAKIA